VSPVIVATALFSAAPRGLTGTPREHSLGQAASMPEIRTVTTLKSKRDEIARAITNYENKIAQAKIDLAHVYAAIRIFVELAKRLKKHGFKDETEASVTNKLKRGTFPATWFLACLAALKLDGVALEEI
jgi:hypothetical protein